MISMKDLKRFINLVVEGKLRKRAAILYIVNDEGNVLSVSRKDDPNKIGLPGGKVDPGEVPAQAAERELFEETGLTVSNLRRVFTHLDLGGFETSTFVGDVEGTIGTDEIGTLTWVTHEMLLDPEISPYWKYNERLFKHLKIDVLA
jgi:8-oxo-dGTP pyrophosphatase MutT (NUDIX family)